MKNYITSAVIIGLSIIVGFAFFGGDTVIEYGAAAGPDHYNKQYFLAGSVQGGTVFTVTATDTAQTLSAANACGNSIVRWDSSGAALTLTLPTAASLGNICLPRIGDTYSFLYENYGGETTTIAVASTTVETLLEPSGGDVVVLTNEWALITFVKRTASTIAIIVESLQDAD